MRPASRRPPAPDPGFLLDPFEPLYLETWRRGLFDRKLEAALRELAECRACPRDCGANRLSGERRACGTGRLAIVSSAFAHFGEEDCLRGSKGSGTIFFGMCNLRCVGDEISRDTYVNLMGQYHPDHEVGRAGRHGRPRLAEIDRPPSAAELRPARAAARDAGIWRLDERVGAPGEV